MREIEIISSEPKTKIEMTLFYFERLGFSLIPVLKNKKPAIKEWKQYQREKATKSQIIEWFSNPDFYPAVVTGKISNIAVIDFDIDKLTKKFSHEAIYIMGQLENSWRSITGSGGKHCFYNLSKSLNSQIRVMPGIDIKAEGGYIILPPAVHDSGKTYEWEVSPWN